MIVRGGMIRGREKAGVWETWDCSGGDWPDDERPLMLLLKLGLFSVENMEPLTIFALLVHGQIFGCPSVEMDWYWRLGDTSGCFIFLGEKWRGPESWEESNEVDQIIFGWYFRGRNNGILWSKVCVGYCAWEGRVQDDSAPRWFWERMTKLSAWHTVDKKQLSWIELCGKETME